ncbi:hypothetical protein ACO22_02092 [Paracoccidioides brasiliensis]|uniref:Zinc/iron permease n=1 Tax=Paracoccidioides brasiliensis TaxID=121759 RepID=A0A1D2JJQ0_PARBR|nr:hypothetical protein ACO22_02092 [Paracoccidioides brasiliensis]
MALDNDTRGWIMSCVSGVACVLGASIICVDLIARNCCGFKNFNIANSNVFLSCSLSLSAGVLIFTSLYSMLPTAKSYLMQAGLASTAASFVLIGLFLAGVVIIQLVSSFIHRYIPSHVVDCMHTHQHHVKGLEDGVDSTGVHYHSQPIIAAITTPTPPLTEHTPLIGPGTLSSTPSMPSHSHETPLAKAPALPLASRLTRRFTSFVGGAKPSCNKDGPCYGLSHACGKECAKIIDQRSMRHMSSRESVMSEQALEACSGGASSNIHPPSHPTSETLHHSRPVSRDENTSLLGIHGLTSYLEDPNQQSIEAGVTHHHHVPQNAFLSIGLQTSLAIALHKLPEGFITYATNHANPTLGFSVFMALSIHNITEGFVMALPLYLALNSRLKAMISSSLLGGISQPAGAGIAALWIWGAAKATSGDGGTAPGTDEVSWAVYGGMFAATAGVMTSVSLQLFSEGLVLSHNTSLCIGFAVLGMGILGFSFALTA